MNVKTWSNYLGIEEMRCCMCNRVRSTEKHFYRMQNCCKDCKRIFPPHRRDFFREYNRLKRKLKKQYGEKRVKEVIEKLKKQYNCKLGMVIFYERLKEIKNSED